MNETSAENSETTLTSNSNKNIYTSDFIINKNQSQFFATSLFQK